VAVVQVRLHTNDL